MKRELVYRHPQGRFDVYRYTFSSPFGEDICSYCETVQTPERDSRGTFHFVRERQAQYIPNPEPRKKETRK